MPEKSPYEISPSPLLATARVLAPHSRLAPLDPAGRQGVGVPRATQLSSTVMSQKSSFQCGSH